MESYLTKQKNRPVFEEAAQKARQRNINKLIHKHNLERVHPSVIEGAHRYAERTISKAVHKHNMKRVHSELKYKHQLWETQQALWNTVSRGGRTVSWADRQLGTERHQVLPRRYGPNVMYEIPK